VSLLVVGLSHRTAEVPVLERATMAAAEPGKLLAELMKSANVTESLLLATCNRVEVYAVVETFHGGMAEVVAALAEHAASDVGMLAEHLYVHYAGAAVEHVFAVAAGLDSMVVGESQILGQLRAAYATAAASGAAGRTLHELAQRALRVGKRVHADTGIDSAGGSVVAEALSDATAALGGSLAGRHAVLVGAGSMGGLAAAHLRRAGVASLTVVNRSPAPARRLADTAAAEGIEARAAGFAELRDALSCAELLVACTGSVGAVVDEATVRAARLGATHPLVVCDLGLPRDVEPDVAELPGVTVIDLATLQERLSGLPAGADVARAKEIVADEVAGYLAAQRAGSVAPTVTALRQRAAEVVAAELLRLESRLPGLDEATRAELAKTVRRVVDKLLHTPTVRIKELAAGPAGQAYAGALRELFDLDPSAPAALVQPASIQDASIQDVSIHDRAALEAALLGIPTQAPPRSDAAASASAQDNGRQDAVTHESAARGGDRA
jgi:glutamyl-tRNA reductase